MSLQALENGTSGVPHRKRTISPVGILVNDSLAIFKEVSAAGQHVSIHPRPSSSRGMQPPHERSCTSGGRGAQASPCVLNGVSCSVVPGGSAVMTREVLGRYHARAANSG